MCKIIYNLWGKKVKQLNIQYWPLECSVVRFKPQVYYPLQIWNKTFLDEKKKAMMMHDHTDHLTLYIDLQYYANLPVTFALINMSPKQTKSWYCKSVLLTWPEANQKLHLEEPNSTSVLADVSLSLSFATGSLRHSVLLFNLRSAGER